MSKSKKIELSENLEYNPLNYLSECIEISYLTFEEYYKNDGLPFRKINNLKGNLQNLEGLIRLGNFFNVKDFVGEYNNVSFNVISFAKIFFLYELYQLKLPNIRINEIYNNLENNNRLKVFEYFFDYYCYIAKQGQEINFYITNNATLLLSPEEYNRNKQMATSIFGCDNKIQTATIISLNEILYQIYNDNKIRKIKNDLFPLSKKELDILIEMNINPGIVNFNIKYDKDGFTPKELNIETKANFELNSYNDLQKLKKEAKDLGYGKLGDIITHKSKLYVTGNKSKKVRLDKKEEKDKIKSLPNNG